MLQARERASTPCSSVAFNLDSHLSPLRSLGTRKKKSMVENDFENFKNIFYEVNRKAWKCT
jgi:hypothetical protein